MSQSIIFQSCQDNFQSSIVMRKDTTQRLPVVSQTKQPFDPQSNALPTEPLYGPCCDKTCLPGYRQSEIQTRLLSYRDKLEN